AGAAQLLQNLAHLRSERPIVVERELRSLQPALRRELNRVCWHECRPGARSFDASQEARRPCARSELQIAMLGFLHRVGISLLRRLHVELVRGGVALGYAAPF